MKFLVVIFIDWNIVEPFLFLNPVFPYGAANEYFGIILVKMYKVVRCYSSYFLWGKS